MDLTTAFGFIVAVNFAPWPFKKTTLKHQPLTKSASVLMGKSLNFFLGWVRARARAPLIGSKTDTGGARARANPTKKKV